MTAEKVLRELKLIGFSDIRKVVSWRNELVSRTEKGKDGEPVMVLMPRVTIVDADKMSDEAAAAVAELWQAVNGALRVKLYDKHAALRWRAVGMAATTGAAEGTRRLMPRVTIVDADKMSDEAAAAVAEVWQTANGALSTSTRRWSRWASTSGCSPSM